MAGVAGKEGAGESEFELEDPKINELELPDGRLER